MLQPGLQVGDVLLEVGLLQGRPHLLVAVAAEGVQVHPEAAGEEDGVLGDDGQGGAEGPQAQLRDVQAVYSDAATSSFRQPEILRSERCKSM